MNGIGGVQFSNAFFLGFLALVPLLWVASFKRTPGSLQLSTIAGFGSKQASSYAPLIRNVLRSLALALMIVALARPQSSSSWENTATEGIDIMIATDISGSMLSLDFSPNRLEAGKNIAIDFIKNRPNDRIGLVVFSGESFTQCPLTIDHDVLVDLLRDVKNGMIEDGTALGMGLATAVNRLKDSEAKSKVVILLTDGVNNTGSIPPLTAGDIARQFNVKVYTVGVGTNGSAPYPVRTPYGEVRYQQVPVEIDEVTMKKIATKTGGRYFRAKNNSDLASIYKQIDQLEKVKIAVTQYSKKTELFFPFAFAAFLLLSVEFVLGTTLFKGVFS